MFLSRINCLASDNSEEITQQIHIFIYIHIHIMDLNAIQFGFCAMEISDNNLQLANGLNTLNKTVQFFLWILDTPIIGNRLIKCENVFYFSCHPHHLSHFEDIQNDLDKCCILSAF